MFNKELLNRIGHIIMANKQSIISMHYNHFRDCLGRCREVAPVEMSLQLTSLSFLGFAVQDRRFRARVWCGRSERAPGEGGGRGPILSTPFARGLSSHR